MKNFHIFFLGLLLGILTLVSCKLPSLAESNTSSPDSSRQISANENESRQINNEIDANSGNEPLKQSNSLFVIHGSISVENKNISVNESFWGYEDNDDDEAQLYPNGKVELDLMNCAGYLASAITTYKMKGGVREVKLIKDTIAPDAFEKIKRCSLDPNAEIPGSDVFGIAPKKKDW